MRMLSLAAGVAAPGVTGAALVLAMFVVVACGPDPAGPGAHGLAEGETAQLGMNGRDGTPLASAQAAPVRPMQLPPGTLRLKRVQIIDQNGFERPLVASTLFVPAGYQPQGGIVWDPRGTEKCRGSYSLEWTAATPDGLRAIGYTSAPGWRATRAAGMPPMPTQGGCSNAAWMSAREFLEAWARATYPGMRVLDYRARPDLPGKLQVLADIDNDAQAKHPAVGMQSRSTTDGGELLIAHAVNGRPVRETIAAAVLVTHTQWADYMSGQITMESISGLANTIEFSRAPEGEFDFRIAQVVRNSWMASPAWMQRIFKHDQVIIDQNTAAMSEQHRIRMGSMQEQQRIRDGQFDANMLSQDRQQRERIEAIRGVETYRDPDAGGAVQLSNQYQHAWRLRDETYVLTNDPNFDPTRFGVEARKLEALP